MKTDDWTKTAKKRCEAIPATPWSAAPHRDIDKWIDIPAAGIRVDNDDVPDGQGEAVTAFVEHARTDLTRALDVIEAADRLVAVLRDVRHARKLVAEPSDNHKFYESDDECHDDCPRCALTAYEEKRR